MVILSNETKNVKQKMLAMIKKEYVPVKMTALHSNLLRFKATGVPDAQWHMKGRRPIMTFEQFNTQINLKHEKSGRAVTTNDIVDILQQSTNSKTIDEAITSPFFGKPVSSSTKYRYKALSALQPNRKIRTKAQAKTEQRYIAENSIISSLCYSLTVASTHILVGKADTNIARVPIEQLSNGAVKLLELVSLANNKADVRTVLPGLVTSTDDSTVFIFKGKSKHDEGWYLVDNNQQESSQSCYSTDIGGTDHLNGLRVRLTMTINGIGAMAAPFITVTGITEKELPKESCESGVYILQIPGLCTGSSMDPRLNAPGYICFVRSERHELSQKSAEQLNFEWYRSNILLPFINVCREKYYSWEPNSTVPEDLTAVCWCDGANVQLNSIINEEQQEKDSISKIVTCKHSRSRTAVEQACDVSPMFRTLKAVARITTAENKPNHGLKGLVYNALKKLSAQKILQLSSVKESALIDFLACYPTIMIKSLTEDIVVKGFTQNGMLDTKSNMCPDIEEMMNTCKYKKYIRAALTSLKKHFTLLYDEQLRCGHISDRFFDSLNCFKRDQNLLGMEVSNYSDTESWQRAKCLSSIHQRQKRLYKLQLLATAQVTKKEQKQLKYDEIHGKALLCTDQLAANLMRPLERNPNLESLTLLEFSKCNKGFLWSFIYIRMYSDLKSLVDESFVMPINKGKLVDAENGEHNMILCAFNLRGKDVIMPLTVVRPEVEHVAAITEIHEPSIFNV